MATILTIKFEPTIVDNRNGYTVWGVENNPAPSSFSDRVDSFPFAAVPTPATQVGNLTQERGSAAGVSSDTHGFAAGGFRSTPPSSPSLGLYRNMRRFPFAAPFAGATFSISNTPTPNNGGVRDSAGINGDTHGYFAGGSFGIRPPSGNKSYFSVANIWRFSFPSGSTATSQGSLDRPRTNTYGLQSATEGFVATGPTPSPPSVDLQVQKFPFSAPTPITTTTVGEMSTFIPDGTSHSTDTTGYIVAGPPSKSGTVYSFPFSAPFVTSTTEGSLSLSGSSSAGHSSTTHAYRSGGNDPAASPSPALRGISTIERFPFSAVPATADNVGDLTQERSNPIGLEG